MHIICPKIKAFKALPRAFTLATVINTQVARTIILVLASKIEDTFIHNCISYDSFKKSFDIHIDLVFGPNFSFSWLSYWFYWL